MIRQDKHSFKNGIIKTQVRVIEGYRDKDGKVKQRTIKNFGYLEDQKDVESFLKQVKEFDDKFKVQKKEKDESFFIPLFKDDSSISQNYGYKFLECIYDSLKLNDFFRAIDFRGQYSLNKMFKFLVIQRILNPDSKRATMQLIDSMYNTSFDFSLVDVYRSLSVFDRYKIELQKHINDQIKKIIGRNNQYAYYDVTNYYCDIDLPDKEGLRQRGVSKEHRVDPIVQMGLFMDDNGLPISMSLFSGNTADCKTLQPIMMEIKKNYELNRIVVVADKGLNSSSNIDYIVNNGDGYVVSQVLRGKKGKRYQEKLFNEQAYIYNSTHTFKYQEFIEDYEITNKDGKKETKQRKVLIYWKYEDAIMEAKKREDKLSRALKSLGNNAFAIKHAYDEYIKEIHYLVDTGEVADKTERVIDEEKANIDALYDGYFCIITSELDYDFSKIIKTYSNLWRIEETFKITKSNLDFRPMYVSTEEHINGHFIICFVALLILRMLQYKMNYSLSIERIVKVLTTCRCTIDEKKIIRLIRNESTKKYNESKLTIEDEDEVMNDYIKILNCFKKEIPYSKYQKKDFDDYLNEIEY